MLFFAFSALQFKRKHLSVEKRNDNYRLKIVSILIWKSDKKKIPLHRWGPADWGCLTMKPQAGWGLRMAFEVDLGSSVAWERGFLRGWSPLLMLGRSLCGVWTRWSSTWSSSGQQFTCGWCGLCWVSCVLRPGTPLCGPASLRAS